MTLCSIAGCVVVESLLVERVQVSVSPRSSYYKTHNEPLAYLGYIIHTVMWLLFYIGFCFLMLLKTLLQLALYNYNNKTYNTNNTNNDPSTFMMMMMRLLTACNRMF